MTKPVGVVEKAFRGIYIYMVTPPPRTNLLTKTLVFPI